VGERIDDLRARLEGIAEELADLALDQLRQAVDAGPDERAARTAEERRLTRARRAVEKAAAILGGAPAAPLDGPDGP
jgi:hypothetical protein